MAQPLVIDCDDCVMQHTDACDDCVVTFLCSREPDEAVVIDVEEVRALRALSAGGLVPTLRHRRRIFADRFRSPFQQHHAPVVAVDIAVQHTGGHSRHFIDHPHGQGTVDGASLGKDQVAITRETSLDESRLGRPR